MEDSVLESIRCQRAHEYVRNFYDDFQSDKVDDAMLNSMLVAQHVDVDDFSHKVDQMVSQGYQKADFWMCKHFWVVVNIMHHLHAFLEMGIQEAM